MNDEILQVVINALGIGFSIGLAVFFVMWGTKSVINIFKSA